MKKSLMLALCFVLATLLFPKAESTQLRPLVLTHVTVIDATVAAAKPEMTVVITSDRITELGPTNKVRIPRDAQVVDATGKFLIPGLWDMHVHLFGKEYLKLFAANGITGVRVMWGFPSFMGWRKEIEDGTMLGPRMVIASPIVDGPKPIWPGSMSVSNELEGRRAVIKVKQGGADFVKVYNLIPRAAY